MKTYLIRHGKSEYAEAEISQRWNSGLAESGKQQILTLKTEFQKIPFNKIYHSPWQRAKQTTDVEKFWIKYSENVDNPDWRFDNSESFNDTLKRVKKLKRLLLSHRDMDVVEVSFP